MLMLVSMALTLMQGHSGLAKAKNQCDMLSGTRQAISIKLATMVALFFSRDLDHDCVWPVHLGFLLSEHWV